MLISVVPRVLAGLLLAVLTYCSRAAEIDERNADIVSDGVRLHADIYHAKAGTQAEELFDNRQHLQLACERAAD